MKAHPGPNWAFATSKPTLRKAAERLATLHTPEGSALPPNALAELQREIARLGFVTRQIKEIEEARQKRLEQEARDRATRHGTAPGSDRRPSAVENG